MINTWKKIIGLREWKIDTVKFNKLQVTYPNDCVDKEKFFIGILSNRRKKEATIFHMRELVEEDIIHELIHVKFPKFNEFWVRVITWICLLSLINKILKWKK